MKRLEPKEIVDKIQQLINSLATRQINIKHNTLYDVKNICFNTVTEEYDVVYASSDFPGAVFSRPYSEFIEKFKPKYGVD